MEYSKSMKTILQSDLPMRRTTPVDDVFTLFVILPTEEVCTLRHLQSGISVEELKSRIELAAGLPSQIYQLVYPDGECLGDTKSLLMQKNVRDGYILRVVLHENWESLYHAIVKNHIDHVCHGEALNIKGFIAMNADDMEKVDGIVNERRTVALYISCFLGHLTMCNTLLSIGADVNGTTPCGRTALHAAACKDNVSLLNLLVDHGACVSKRDVYGQTPTDTAIEHLSKLCVKRLRLMQLNLRGETKQFHDRSYQKTPNAEPPREPSPPTEPVEPPKITRSITITLPTDAGRNTKSPQIPTENRLTESRNSENRSVVNVSTSTPLHPWDTLPTRKSIFATDNMFSPRFLSRFNYNTKRGQNIMMERQHNKQKEYINTGEANAKLLGKQLSILRSKRTLKFVNEDDKRNEDQSEISGSTTTTGTPYVLAPPVGKVSEGWRMEKFDKSDDNSSQATNVPVRDMRKVKIDLENQTLLPPTPVPARQKSASHVKFSGKTRSPSYPSKHAVEVFRNMKRKINLVASHQNGQNLKTKFRYGDSYEKWLMKKKMSERRRPKSESSSEDESDSDIVSSDAYSKWLDDKKHNRTKYERHVTGNRPIPGLITIGSTEVGEAKNPDASQNIHAYRDWHDRRRTKTPNYERMRNGEEFMEQKRKLEEKRQKLMMTTLSYEEWMDHTEDRKSLIRKILKADLEQLKVLEEERLRVRAPHQITHEDWKIKLKKRQDEERARREIQLKYQEENDRWKKDFIRSSAAITHQEWLRQKEMQLLKDKDKLNLLNENKTDPEKKLSEAEKAYEAWINKKHEKEVSDIKSKMEKEGNFIETLYTDRSLPLVETLA